jgi:hypothetical protein
MADTGTVLLFVLIVGALVAGMAGVVWHNGRVLGLSSAAGRRRAGGTLLLLGGWLGVMGILAANGFFDTFLTRFPPPFALALLPPWITIFCCIAIPPLRSYLAVTPMSWLIGYQVFRVGIEYVLWDLYHQGLMPRAMTFEGQNIDLLVGITAPLIALLVARHHAWTRLLALAWNGMALLILLNTIRVAFQSFPGIFYDPAMQPPNTIVSQFPFIWLPAFVVPVALLGHAIALAQVVPDVLYQKKQPSFRSTT